MLIQVDCGSREADSLPEIPNTFDKPTGETFLGYIDNAGSLAGGSGQTAE